MDKCTAYNANLYRSNLKKAIAQSQRNGVRQVFFQMSLKEAEALEEILGVAERELIARGKMDEKDRSR